MTSNEAQFTRILNWAALGVAGVLLLVVVLDIYQRHLFSSTSVDTAGLQFDDLPGTQSQPLIASTDGAIAQHIFGKKLVMPNNVVTKAVPKPKPKPRTPLKVTLTGVIEGATPETGLAMLGTGRGKTSVVAIGEEIGKTGAVLKEVYPAKIIVDRDGYDEEIELKRNELKINTELPDMPINDSITITGAISAGETSEGLQSHNRSTRRERPRGKMGQLPIPRSLKNL